MDYNLGWSNISTWFPRNIELVQRSSLKARQISEEGEARSEVLSDEWRHVTGVRSSISLTKEPKSHDIREGNHALRTRC